MFNNLLQSDKTSLCIQHVVIKTKNDDSLTYAIIIDSLYKWSKETQHAILRLVSDNKTSKEKLNGIVLALIEYTSNNNQIDMQIIDVLRNKLNSFISNDNNDDCKELVDNVMRLLFNNVKFENVIEWYRSRLTFYRINAITSSYIESFLTYLKHYLTIKPVSDELELELRRWASEIYSDITSKKKTDYVMPNYFIAMNYHIYTMIEKTINLPLNRRIWIIRVRLFIRSLIIQAIRNTGSYFSILGVFALITAYFGYLHNEKYGAVLFPFICAILGSAIYIFLKVRYKELLTGET